MKLLTLAALVLLAAAPAYAQDDEDAPSLDDTPHITITGTASEEAKPDLAIVSLGVQSHKAQAAAAADAVAVSARAVIDAAKANGVESTDIATQSVTLRQSFEDVRDAQGRVTGRTSNGFDAANTIAVRIRDLAAAGKLTQNMIDKGANSFEGITFTVEHPQPILDKLAAEATANARRQAELVAQAAGTKLGRVLLIVRPDTEDTHLRTRAFATARLAAAPAEMPLEAGTASFGAQVTVTWALEK